MRKCLKFSPQNTRDADHSDHSVARKVDGLKSGLEDLTESCFGAGV
jgi:hypothetical protein